jgi:HPt (histidine-containing phosphotransfer) domain-containing protein
MNKKFGDLPKGRVGPIGARRQGASAIDLEHLRQYTLGDVALQSELLELFRVQARVQLDLISIAALPEDFNLAVHTLKGAALVIGARGIVATARELETQPFPHEAAKRRQLTRLLAEQIAAIEAEIAEILAEVAYAPRNAGA